MPELPDIVVYLEALEQRLVGEELTGRELGNPFLLRTVTPAFDRFVGAKVVAVHRSGKRIVLEFEQELFVVIHLMIAGRLHWKPAAAKLPKRRGLLALRFASGALFLTEAGSKRRASLHLLEGRNALEQIDRGGVEVLDCDFDEFAAALVRENHTLKRSLTDPRIFSGIGNSYSDEILHRAGLSPFALSQSLPVDHQRRLFAACREVLVEWLDRLRTEVGDGFPTKVTAFRPEMSVHGRFGQPCPVCEAPVQRIVYASNQANYCPGCQTGGKIYADRALSRLLRDDWPRSLDELDDRPVGGVKKS